MMADDDDLDIDGNNDSSSIFLPVLTLSTIETEQEYKKQIEANIYNQVEFLYSLFFRLK